MPVFARQGFAGTTTKQLAAATGVSESLLYKHFPSKQALYEAIQESVCGSLNPALQHIQHLPNGAETLALIVFAMMDQMLHGNRQQNYNPHDFDRIMFQSYLSDGEFASLVHQLTFAKILPKFKACLKQATADGDAMQTPGTADFKLWQCHHLVAFMCIGRQHPDLFSYSINSSRTFQETFRFLLAGIGLQQPAIERVADTSALASRLKGLFE